MIRIVLEFGRSKEPPKYFAPRFVKEAEEDIESFLMTIRAKYRDHGQLLSSIDEVALQAYKSNCYYRDLDGPTKEQCALIAKHEMLWKAAHLDISCQDSVTMLRRSNERLRSLPEPDRR